MRKFEILVDGVVAAVLEIEVVGASATARWNHALRPVGKGGAVVTLQAYAPDSEVPVVLPGDPTTTWTARPRFTTTPAPTVSGPAYTDGAGVTVPGPGDGKQWADSTTSDGVAEAGGDATNSRR